MHANWKDLGHPRHSRLAAKLGKLHQRWEQVPHFLNSLPTRENWLRHGQDEQENSLLPVTGNLRKSPAFDAF